MLQNDVETEESLFAFYDTKARTRTLINKTLTVEGNCCWEVYRRRRHRVNFISLLIFFSNLFSSQLWHGCLLLMASCLLIILWGLFWSWSAMSESFSKEDWFKKPTNTKVQILKRRRCVELLCINAVTITYVNKYCPDALFPFPFLGLTFMDWGFYFGLGLCLGHVN